ncbi:transcription factor SPT20 homolog [Anthonomus grandis grandis]|uniref:transcription factor SPT20 homolog n=1 Tax=Anthonomus grandis grandis TaxID=2921223 RepID=UPI002166B33E|nr:transcription factor SPT20 homolog [Anthonomus grandis grandis]
MYLAFLLVSIILSASQCRSHPVEPDRQYSFDGRLYEDYKLVSDHNRIKQETQTLLEVPRAQGIFQLQYEPQGENYPEDQHDTQNVATIPTQDKKGSRQAGRHTHLPVVEQYLKEVTPTTKTVQTVYTLKTKTRSKEDPVAQNILAYHNAFLAHQNAAYEQQRINQLKKEQQQQLQQDIVPNSEIFVSKQIQKANPVARTVIKPKPGSLDEELEYYTKLQYHEQQKKEKTERYQTKQTAAAQTQFKILQNPANFAPEQVIALQPEEHQHPATTRIVKPAELPQEPLLPDINNQQKVEYQSQSQQPQIQEIRYYQQQPQPEPHFIQYQPQHLMPSRSPERQQTYTTKIVRYSPVQAELDAGTKQTVNINQQQYVLENPTYQQQRYEIQQNREPQYIHAQLQGLQVPNQPEQGANAGPSDEDYQQSQFKKSLGRNSSLRVLKTGKSVVFIGHDE